MTRFLPTPSDVFTATSDRARMIRYRMIRELIRWRRFFPNKDRLTLNRWEDVTVEEWRALIEDLRAHQWHVIESSDPDQIKIDRFAVIAQRFDTLPAPEDFDADDMRTRAVNEAIGHQMSRNAPHLLRGGEITIPSDPVGFVLTAEDLRAASERLNGRGWDSSIVNGSDLRIVRRIRKL